MSKSYGDATSDGLDECGEGVANSHCGIHLAKRLFCLFQEPKHY